MSIEGWVLMGCILAIFATFSVVLAWGAHQTNSLAKRSENTDASAGAKSAKPDFAPHPARAA